MKAFRFLEIPGGNKKAIKSVDEILKILKAMQVECQNTSCMILVQINKMKLTIICDDVYTNKRHGLYLYSNGSKYNILYTVGKSLRNK